MQSVLPKLPMRDIALTRSFYCDMLGFHVLGEYEHNYPMVGRDNVEIHLFLMLGLHAEANYGTCYIGVKDKIDELYRRLSTVRVTFASLGHLERKPWGSGGFR